VGGCPWRRASDALSGVPGGPEGPWAQERGLLQQELRLFRHNTVIFYMKLRWILLHWRLDRRSDPRDEAPHPAEVGGHPPHMGMDGPFYVHLERGHPIHTLWAHCRYTRSRHTLDRHTLLILDCI
jgi:hypothetical protein